MSRSTISDVAALAGVSRTTVSRYLNSPESVSPQTRQAVKSAMDKLQYRPSSLARTLRTKKSCTIGLVVPDITAPFFSELASVVQATALQYGYTVFLCSSGEDVGTEQRFVRTLIDHNVDGLIYIATGHSGRTLDLNSIPVPVVALDRHIFADNVASVISDNAAGGELVAEHLAALDHTSALLVMGSTHLPTYADRLRGFIMKWTNPADSIRRTYHCIECPVDTGGARRATRDFMAKNGVDFTCVFAGTDFMAAGVIMALSERGLSVPGQISVVGYDNSSVAYITSPPLTTVDQPKDDMARLGVERLIQLIEQEDSCKSSNDSDRVFVLNPTLVVGRSTSRVAQKCD